MSERERMSLLKGPEKDNSEYALLVVLLVLAVIIVILGA